MKIETKPARRGGFSIVLKYHRVRKDSNLAFTGFLCCGYTDIPRNHKNATQGDLEPFTAILCA